jgi:protein-disulfide isomerase
MKRALVAITILISATAAAQQRVDPTLQLKSYAEKMLPRCPGGTVTLEPIPSGPSGFRTYIVTLRSSDRHCGTQKHLLHSSKSQQVLLGNVIPLPSDGRPAGERLTEHASKLLGKPVKATVSPFPLPDGIRMVSIARETAYGPFAYQAYLDSSEKFMFVGSRGTLTTDPRRTLREALGTESAARRGNAAAAVEVIEISDFQCPTCAVAHEKLEPLIQKNLSKINYLRIDLPLFENHQWALPAAMGARAIQRVAPAKYWRYVDYVFSNQEAIGRRPFDQVLREFSDDHDVDWPAVQKIYGSKAERQALLEQVSRAFSIGVASTPTFIVNGQIVSFGPDGAHALAAIQLALASAAQGQ